MNQAVAATVHSIYKTEQLANPEQITLDVLESVEDIVLSSNINKEFLHSIDSNFGGMIIIKVYPEGDVKCVSSKQKCLTKNDSNKINKWLQTNDHPIYANDYYRLDLDNYILMFKVYKFNNNKLLIGHMLENKYDAKIKLIEIRQNFLMRNFT